MCHGIAPAQASNLANRPVHGTPENLYQVGHMHMLDSILTLAQVGDTPVVSWLGFGVSLVVAALLVVQHFRPSPPNHDRYARREMAESLDSDLKALKVEVAKMVSRDEFAELSHKIDEGQKMEATHYERILDSGSKRAANIYARIDAVNEKISGLAIAVARLEAKAKKPGENNGQD